MRVLEILSQHRNDFTAMMICEHCNHQLKNYLGYDDSYYHNYVIPAMHCKECGKNRKGDLTELEKSVTAESEGAE